MRAVAVKGSAESDGPGGGVSRVFLLASALPAHASGIAAGAPELAIIGVCTARIR
jgi:hypothetical protein